MEISKKIGSEITVRISLTFQEAPDVHTLLAMTPIRERGKLVRLALERYISSTNHPAGDINAQIEAVSQWLRNRSQPTHADKGGGELARSPFAGHISSPTIDQSATRNLPSNADESANTNLSKGLVDELASKSMQRWLDG